MRTDTEQIPLMSPTADRGGNEPGPPRQPNRATRRAIKALARRKPKRTK